MLAKLLASTPPVESIRADWQTALVGAGVAAAAELPELRVKAAWVERGYVAGRIRRCLRDSTDFSVRRGPLRTVFRRRAAADSGVWVEGTAELVRYWMGDRALEILDRRPPRLAALARPHLFSPARPRLQLSVADAGGLEAMAPELLDGYRRYEALNRPR